MKTCPYCEAPIKINELPHPGLFASYRNCPECGGSFTVDEQTKKRQFIAIVLMVVMLLLTVLLYLYGKVWLVPAGISYFGVAVFTYWANRKLYFVEYTKQSSRHKN